MNWLVTSVKSQNTFLSCSVFFFLWEKIWSNGNEMKSQDSFRRIVISPNHHVFEMTRNFVWITNIYGQFSMWMIVSVHWKFLFSYHFCVLFLTKLNFYVAEFNFQRKTDFVMKQNIFKVKIATINLQFLSLIFAWIAPYTHVDAANQFSVWLFWSDFEW